MARFLRGTSMLLVALVLSLGIKDFAVQAFFIPSESMTNTLQVGDRVLVDKVLPRTQGLRRGEVVVFRDPGGWLSSGPTPTPTAGGYLPAVVRSALISAGAMSDPSTQYLVKRLIGLPGDTVVCCDAGGRLQVNGTAIGEPYLRAGDRPSQVAFTATVRPGRIWVMGDHRSNSLDSRFHRDIDDGQVPIDDVVGRVFAVVWPWRQATLLPDRSQVFAAVPSSRPAQGTVAAGGQLSRSP